jgi:hypothetical protein
MDSALRLRFCVAIFSAIACAPQICRVRLDLEEGRR